ncbi:MAG: LPP20 family lipoprotein [Candidatus Pacebacteria bacterium]|nr:LPP20 family lipoprotein [Candidatus Paceibacterota bacterium]
MKIKTVILSFALIAFIGALAAGPVAAETKEVIAVGEGKTREEAKENAFREAISQINGIRQDSTAAQNSNSSTIATDKETVNSLVEDNQKNIRTKSGGVIGSWREISSTTNNGIVTIKIAATVQVAAKDGNSNNDTRRKIAVAIFEVNDNNNDPMALSLHKKLVASLTQSRRFVILDPLADAAIKKEMTRLDESEMDFKQKSMVGQALGAEYLITGSIQNYNSSYVDRTIKLTGEKLQRVEAGAEFNFSIFDIASRQVKWAGTISVKGKANGAQNQATETAAGANLFDEASRQIADDLVQNIYPLRLLDATNPQNLTIGQGGNTVIVGERYGVYQLGEEIKDPYTKESLGRQETEIGTLVITRVTAKLSYGQWEGTAPAVTDPDMVVRKLK